MRHVWVLEKHLKTNSKTKTCSNFSCKFSVIKPAESILFVHASSSSKGTLLFPTGYYLKYIYPIYLHAKRLQFA